ncbi:hypothetical protein IMX26_07145 [Clostridium sp. 'deep sea']|uniref:hypothetical protein n=1 Tax=Clostridium sp. 'deep sea' TaxID=2779445 RepID=UPI0018967E6B|nr:hypothetical protein [Clostridium sp. 'deep sea']QOR36576.1 hypothetical protein IMX26_07145 [Clostridium sp. 'deep sea']
MLYIKRKAIITYTHVFAIVISLILANVFIKVTYIYVYARNQNLAIGEKLSKYLQDILYKSQNFNLTVYFVACILAIVAVELLVFNKKNSGESLDLLPQERDMKADK